MHAYKEAKAAEDSTKDFDLWCKEQEDESFIYFFGILKHLLIINQLVRSIREASFDLFVASIKQLCPLLFALDHIHYSRWIPVFILDLRGRSQMNDVIQKSPFLPPSPLRHRPSSLSFFTNKTGITKFWFGARVVTKY